MVTALFIPLVPLVVAALLLAARRPLRGTAGYLATSAVGASFVLALMSFGDLLDRSPGERLTARVAYDWISVGDLRLPVELRIDPLSMTMALVVTGVGALIHAYSIGYMADDPRRGTYFGYLNLFVASMLILVLANNFLLLYLGWELVGVCSYLLISFWRHRPAAAAAGKKAFIVNRVGDVGLLIGIFLIFDVFGTLDFDRVFEAASSRPVEGALATAIPLLLFVGACGKSAQIPLHVWLPDAMEGPTPVSALIHAATMVTAGVYLVARAHPLFEASQTAALTVAVVGSATALFAATIAVVQDDIKRVLAYSTISQLGYMFLAVGVGAITGSSLAYAAGIFHLVTHAFFKALLFLGAGSVMHATSDTTDMKRMGGLLRVLPVTGATFLVGWLAISGIPPLSGFFSKDAVLAVTWESGLPLLWAVGIVTALITAFYMSRQVFLTFFGPSRLPEGVHPHESPPVMTFPLRALAGLAALGGFIGLTLRGGAIYRWLEPVFGPIASEGHGSAPPVHIPEILLAGISVGAGILGIGLARRLYLTSGADERRARLRTR
ncbi:MAG: NADH-quinone oxidoreductase subunit L, partial [Actinomycetota bacterium]